MRVGFLPPPSTLFLVVSGAPPYVRALPRKGSSPPPSRVLDVDRWCIIGRVSACRHVYVGCQHSLYTSMVCYFTLLPLAVPRSPAPAYAALCAQRDRVTSQFGSSLDVDYSGPDLEEDTGQEAVVPGTISVASMNLRAPPASERASVVNPIFAGSGSRMNRPWPTKNKGGEHRNSLTSTETEMSSGEDLEQAWPPEGEPPAASGGGRDATRSSPAVQDGAGRRADGGKAGAALTAHPSSWAGYGGASAWVRSSSRDVTPSARGAKVGARRGPSRF